MNDIKSIIDTHINDLTKKVDEQTGDDIRKMKERLEKLENQENKISEAVETKRGINKRRRIWSFISKCFMRRLTFQPNIWISYVESV